MAAKSARLTTSRPPSLLRDEARRDERAEMVRQRRQWQLCMPRDVADDQPLLARPHQQAIDVETGLVAEGGERASGGSGFCS